MSTFIIEILLKNLFIFYIISCMFVCYLYLYLYSIPSSEVEDCISKGEINVAVGHHVKLYRICSALQPSACQKLQKYSYDVCEKLYEQLKAAIER